ncbi:MAG: hypothetical protein ACP5IL_08165 [Syntrophobacteraceae bacterium]
MGKSALAIVLFLMLSAVASVCAAQQAPPGKWINRTLANTAAREAARRAKEVPPGRWWRLPYFAVPLQINELEKERLDSLFDYNRNKLAELKTRVEEERGELVAAIDQQHLDETSAMARMKKLEDSRSLLAATQFSYSLEVRKLLGYQRFEHLKTLFQNWNGLNNYPGGEAKNGLQPSQARQPANLGMERGRYPPGN